MDKDQRAYKLAQWQCFFEVFEEYIKAVVINETSIHVEDSVRLTQLREGLINTIVDKEFDLA